MKALPKPQLPNTAQLTTAAHRMINSGGSFDHYIGKAYINADAHNRDALIRTFASRFIAFIPHD